MPLIILKSPCFYSRDRDGPNFAFTATLTFNCEEENAASSRGNSIDNEDKAKIQVDLLYRGRQVEGPASVAYYELQLRCLRQSPSQFLKVLRIRHEEKVKVSLSITAPAGLPVTKRVLSAEKMTINGQEYFCRAIIGPIKIPFLDEAIVRGGGWHLKLILDIPEPKTVGKDVLHKALEEKVCSDLVITAKNGVKVDAHRFILAVHSPVFLANFRSGMKESLTGQLDMSDVSEEAVRALLDFLYKDDLTKAKENLEVAFELLCAGHKYEMLKLEVAMKKRLMEAKDEDIGIKLAYKVYEFLRQTETGAASELKIKIVQVLKLKMTEFMELPEIQQLFQNTLENGISAMDVFWDFSLINARNQNNMQFATGIGDLIQKPPTIPPKN